MTTALIVVDLQNDFCPGGALAVAGGDAIVPVVNRLIAAFEHVILTQDWHPAGHASFASSHAGRSPFESITLGYGTQTLWPDHCVQNTTGAQFHPGMAAGKAELVIRKGFRRNIDSYSAFFENDRRTPTGLAGYLRDRGFDRLVMCGLATDYCVGWSALDGRNAGFAVSLVEDASAAIDLDGSLARARAEMDAAGVARIDSARAMELA
jgi:nicotinamidase/pyrazinamidase